MKHLGWRLPLLIALVTIGIASLGSGLSTVAGDLIYYSDATYTTEVGEWIKNCQGQNWHYGQSTSFYAFADFYSCESGGRACTDPLYPNPCLVDGFYWGCCR